MPMYDEQLNGYLSGLGPFGKGCFKLLWILGLIAIGMALLIWS
jgi:hypothetical protein